MFNPAGGNAGVAPIIMPLFLLTTNPSFNSMSWLENVPLGSKIDIYVFERINGQEVALCHGKATSKPWESQGVEGLQDLTHTFGLWVDLVAKTKVANHRGPVIKLIVANNDHTADVKVSGGPSADQVFKGYTWGIRFRSVSGTQGVGRRGVGRRGIGDMLRPYGSICCHMAHYGQPN